MEPHATCTGNYPNPDDSLSQQEKEVKACKAFQEYVEKSPELQAIFRHFSTVISMTQRVKLVMDLKNKPQQMMTYDSEFYPLEPMWYMDTVLSKQRPTLSELWCHRHGVLNSNWAIYSYLNEQTGLLARHHITLLVNPVSPNFDGEFDLAIKYKDTIFELGGICSVSTVGPDIRHFAINVVIGIPPQKWANFYVKLYSPLLFIEVLEKKKFDPTAIGQFLIPMQPPSRLNLEYISKLV